MEDSHQQAKGKNNWRNLGLVQTYFQDSDTPTFFFDFVVDPNTFLHICLIIRYGFIRIRLDQDDISVIESTNINKGGKGIDLNTQVRKQRAITLHCQHSGDAGKFRAHGHSVSSQ